VAITVVQSKTIANALSGSFTSSTTAGNCVVVVVNAFNNSSTPSVSGVTLGGSADNFTQAVSVVNSSSSYVLSAIWVDPGCAGGQTAVAVSGSNLTVNSNFGITIYEVSGLAASNVTDKTSSSSANSGTSWTSGTTATTTQANEFWIGAVTTAATSFTQPGAWTNSAYTSNAGSGYQIVSSTGTATYNATLSPSTDWSACVAALKPNTTVSLPVAQVNIQAYPPQPVGNIVNQWSNSIGQGTTFASITSSLQSCVVQLNNTYSVGGGSGTPTAGNWLFAIASWTQDPSLAEVHIGVSDDARNWWRQYPASSISGKTRTSISYAANISSPSLPVPAYVYVAPDGQTAALTVLVIEVAGLGPWDTVGAGYPVTNYAAAATSLSLSGGAPGAASFFLAGVGGDSTAATQTFAPGGWTPLYTVSQSDGSDQLASSYLTSAYLASSSSSQSVSASAGSATDLSGFMIAVYKTGTNPIPAAQNPNWPYLKCEAAFGSGYNTPVSEMTWTDLTNRLWDWDGSGGIQFQLGQMQSGEYTIELDNYDAALTSTNASGPYYPDVQPGTPIRIRAALGTIGGVTADRWYVIALNAGEWTEKIDESYRRYVELSATDLWAALSATPPTFYRSEIYADQPYVWWPCDDQPGTAGVLPTTLLNAAVGNTNVLNIAVSPNGAIAQVQAEKGNGSNAVLNAGAASYAVGASAGWMFGDPQGSPASLGTGNPVTSTPGSAAWQASGQYGTTGSYGWFLYCNDASFPTLTNGITVEGWFNYNFWGDAHGYLQESGGTATLYAGAGQPVATLTLMELATSSHPVAILYLDTSGHLILETFNGASGTTHSIYTASDLRASTWFMITMTLTTTTWNVQVNGGVTANVSGTATGMTAAWTWLILNGDLAANGGSSAGTGLVHGGNVQISHVAVYPVILPYYRIMAHYWAAVTSFGEIPAPTGIQYTPVGTNIGPISPTAIEQTDLTYTPDGTRADGVYGSNAGFTATVPYAFSTVVVANVGSYHSGPSAWAVTGGEGTFIYDSGTTAYYYDGFSIYVSWTGVAPSFAVYTANQVGAETNAATVTANSDTFEDGKYGSSTTGVGPGQTATGTGASPPSSGSAVGDTVGQRIGRLMHAGLTTSPARCIDPAPLLVQAPGTSGGGIQAGAAIQQIQQSDSGMLYVDSQNNLTYWQRPHLASQYSNPVWALGTDSGKIPYWREIQWPTDPQRIIDAITVQPLSPTGAALAEYTPTNSSGVETSQALYGAQPFQITSWLQDTSKMQEQANWLFTNWGVPRRRVENVKVDAASHPAAWPLVLGISVGDVVSCQDWQIGGGGSVYTYRVTTLRRHIEFGGPDGREMVGAVWITADFEPSSYWS
jgi:hypothetical protein